MRKTLLLLAIIALCLSLCFIFDSCDSSKSLTFELDGEEYIVVDCDIDATKVTIPKSYKGKPVTSIGDKAFYDCTSLTSVKIPNRATLPSLHPQNYYCTL